MSALLPVVEGIVPQVADILMNERNERICGDIRGRDGRGVAVFGRAGGELMADQADVEAALAAIAANGVYPQGSAAASVVGAGCKIYRGWPASPVLDADLAAGMAHVSVSATDAAR